jgi:hypothetical protein
MAKDSLDRFHRRLPNSGALLRIHHTQLGKPFPFYSNAIPLADSGAASEESIETLLRRLQEMTRSAEHEIHAIVLSCVRARRQMLASLPTKKPTLH